MKIDILFLNNEMNGHDEYFDNDLFQEYCETHSFEGKANQIIVMPASYSKKENLFDKKFLNNILDNHVSFHFGKLKFIIGTH